MAEEEGQGGAPEGEFYALLNVSSEATEEEIRSAYKRLSLMFHPDKHPDSHVGAVAHFQRITRAYEVLSDPSLRPLYDLYGEEGLRLQLQVGESLHTYANIKEEYERIRREREEEKLRAQLRPRGTVIASFSANHLLHPYSSALPFTSRFLPEMRHMAINQAVESSITKQDHLSFSGLIMSRNGLGITELSSSYRRDLTPTSSAEISGSVGNRPSVTLKASNTRLPFGCFGTASTTFRFEGEEIRIGRSFTVGAPVSNTWVGHLSYKSGLEDPGMIVGFTQTKKDSMLRISTQIGEENSWVNLGGSYEVMEGTKVKANVMLSTNSVSLLVGTEKKVTLHTKMGLSLEIAQPQGVTLHVKLNRLGQSLSLPIHMSEELSIYSVLVSALVPFTFASAINQFIVRPLVEKKRKEDLEKLRSSNEKRMREGRANAESAIALMKESTLRKKEAEANKNGLVIVQALYGNLTCEESRRQGQDAAIIDVTIPLQSLVHNSKLYITNKSKAGMIGFCDPCVGEEKRLSVRYLFKNRLHHVVINDNDSLALPLRSHALREES